MIGGVQVVDSVADGFATLVSDVLARPRRGGFSLFLSGGSTAGEAYQRLAHQIGEDSGLGQRRRLLG